MPAPVLCTPAFISSGADSTSESIAEYKQKIEFTADLHTRWFSDQEINAVLNIFTIDTQFKSIDPVIVPILMRNFGIDPKFYEKHIKASVIFIPILVRDCHWIILIYDNSSSTDYWIDPLEDCPFHSESLRVTKILHVRLNAILGTNHRLLPEPLSQVRFQDNGYDCGPMICFYAIQIMKNSRLDDESVSMILIRKLAFEIINKGGTVSKIKKLIGGGFLPISDMTIQEIFHCLQFYFKNQPKILVLENEVTQSIITNNKDFIIENICFKAFKNVLYVVCILRVELEPFIYIYKRSECSSIIVSLLGLENSSLAISIATQLTQYMDIFFLKTHTVVQIDVDPSVLYPNQTNTSILVQNAIGICSQHLYYCTSDFPDIPIEDLIDKARHLDQSIHDSITSVNGKMNLKTIGLFFESLNLDESNTFINATMTTALLDDNWQYLSVKLDFARVKQSKIIYCLISPPDFHPCLIVVDNVNWEYFLFNPTTNMEDQNLTLYATHTVEKLCSIAFFKHISMSRNNCKYLSKGSGLFSWILICGYMECFAMGLSLTEINLKRISVNITKMLNPSNPVKVIEPRSMSELKPSLKERTDKCNDIIDTIKDFEPEQINDALIANTSVRPKVKHFKPYLGEKTGFKLPNKIQIRQIFKNNMKNAVNMILSETVATGSPSIDDIRVAFKKEAPNMTEWPILNFCPTYSPSLDIEPITCLEIVSKFKTLKTCAPGPDGVHYSHLKQLDPEGKLLCLFFNKIIETGKSPKSWKCFQTTLIPKPNKESYENISNWRPIALSNSTYKIFTSLLADRLSNWINHHQILLPGQKGVSQFEGCIEHNSILNTIFEQAKSYPGPHTRASIAFMDLQNAFPSVPHQYLWQNLKAYGVSQNLINILADLYEDTTSFYKCGRTITPEIRMNVGVKQGCPLSMLLFALSINPVLKAIDQCNIDKYRLFGHDIQILAYADDIAIVATNPNDLQTLINTANEAVNHCCMAFKPSKCAYIDVPFDGESKSEIHINGTFIQKLCPGEFYDYLVSQLAIMSNNRPSS